MNRVKVKTLRACCIGGHRVESGVKLSVDAIDAYSLVGSSKAQLVNEEDHAQMCADVRHEAARLARARRSRTN